MASGHVYRANRPNTWLLRPTLQSEDSPCQHGAVHTWPIATYCTAALPRSQTGYSENRQAAVYRRGRRDIRVGTTSIRVQPFRREEIW